MEYYYPDYYVNIISLILCMFVRMQALDSSMKSSNLKKYVTKYLGLNKQNRVYVPGDN